MTNPFNRADKHGAPDMRVTPPASAEAPMAPPPAMNVGGTWYPLDAGEPTYAELKEQRDELLAALDRIIRQGIIPFHWSCFAAANRAIAKAKAQEVSECKFCGKEYTDLQALRDHQRVSGAACETQYEQWYG